MLWTYRATITRWVDGDTFDAMVDLGFHTYRQDRFRLIAASQGVDTPEMNSRDPAERERARAAMARSLELAPLGLNVILRTHKGDAKDGFGRFLAELMLPDGRSLGDVLLSEGQAVPYER